MKTIRLFNQRISFQYSAKSSWLLFLGACLCVLLISVSLSMGSFSASISDVILTLRDLAPTEQHQLVVWEFRLPRTLVSALVGALFALSGAALQTLTRNPLADPSLIGISQGAALAVVIFTVLLPEFSAVGREWIAFSGGLLVAILIRLIAGHGHSLKFILMGIGLSFFIAAFTQAFLTYGAVVQAISALAWLAGSINQATWADVQLLSLVLVFLLVVFVSQSRAYRPIALGQETSVGLGINMRLFSLVQLLGAVVAAAVATAVVGPLGFIGLLAPHLARRIMHTGPTGFIFLTALTGAVLVLLADLVGRTAFGSVQIAAGLLTSLIGAPIFIYLMLKKQTKESP